MRSTPRHPTISKFSRGHRLSPGYLFYPAQFWPHKNHVALLQALRILKDEHGIVRPLVLVGSDKGNLDFIRNVAEQLGVAAQMHLPGFVSQQELIALYRNALALTYVSYFGPENLPPLEAFALGCPVVAADVDGAAEQLADAALRISPESPQQIAAAIKKLIDQPALRAALIDRGKKRALRFTGPDFVRGMFGIFDELSAARSCWPSSSMPAMTCDESKTLARHVA